MRGGKDDMKHKLVIMYFVLYFNANANANPNPSVNRDAHEHNMENLYF